MKIQNIRRRRRGAALVEYGLIIAGVALISAAAISIFGHKTSDLIAAVATILPGAHTDDNGTIMSGKLIETTAAGNTSNVGTGAALDVNTILNSGSGNARLGLNVGNITADGFGGLINEAQ